MRHLLLVASLFAAPLGFARGYGLNGRVQAIRPLRNGQIAVFGNFAAFEPEAVSELVKLDGMGRLANPRFFDAKLEYPEPVRQLVRAPDGSYFASSRDYAWHVLADGSRDTHFADRGVIELRGMGTIGIAVAPDGSAFFAIEPEPEADVEIRKVLPNGQIDRSYADLSRRAGLKKGFDSELVMRVDARGGLLLAGHMKLGATVPHLVRFDERGNYDAAFASALPALTRVPSVEVLKDGSIVLADTESGRILFLDAQGALRRELGRPTECPDSPLSMLAVDESQNLYAAYDRCERAVGEGRSIFKMNLAGVRDTAYRAHEFPASCEFSWYGNHQFRLIPGGGAVVAAACLDRPTRTPRFLYKLRADGSIDPNFTAPIESGAGVESQHAPTLVAVSADEIVLAPDSRLLGGEEIPALIVLNHDGSLDRSFRFEGWNGYLDTFSDAKILEMRDGALLVGAYTREEYGCTFRKVLRDGRFDASFAAIHGVSCALPIEQSDGHLVFVSSLQQQSGTAVRYSSSGAPLGRLAAVPADASIQTIAAAPGEKIMVNGQDAAHKAFIVRTFADGTLDPSFQLQEDEARSWITYVAPDSSVWIIRSIPSWPYNSLALTKLTPTGARDRFVTSRIRNYEDPASMHLSFTDEGMRLAGAPSFDVNGMRYDFGLLYLNSTADVKRTVKFPAKLDFERSSEFDADGNIVSGDYQHHLARFFGDGRLDESFQAPPH